MCICVCVVAYRGPYMCVRVCSGLQRSIHVCACVVYMCVCVCSGLQRSIHVCVCVCVCVVYMCVCVCV